MPYKDRDKQLLYFKNVRERKTPEQREAHRIRAHESYLRHREKNVVKRRENYLKNKQKYLAIERERQYKLRYGITTAVYNDMLAAQGSRCAICGTDRAGNKGQYFAVDHCHETGAVRGLLCISCNARLGWLEWFEQHKDAIGRYLKMAKEKVS